MEHFRGRRVLIAGGGDSALDWALNLHPVASRITLVHRRDEFRAAPHSVNAMRELVAEKKMDLVIAQLVGLKGEGDQLSAVTVRNADQATFDVPTDDLLAFYGLTMKLGPIAEWGLNLHENLIPVDTEKFETSAPRHLRHRRHHHLSGQAEADPVGLPRGGAGGAEGAPLRLSRQEAALPVHDFVDQPAAQARRQLRRTAGSLQPAAPSVAGGRFDGASSNRRRSSSAGQGWANRKPCISVQPSSCTSRICRVVSTPSAVTSM